MLEGLKNSEMKLQTIYKRLERLPPPPPIEVMVLRIYFGFMHALHTPNASVIVFISNWE